MSEQHEPSEDELIDAALAALDQAPLPTTTVPGPAPEPAEEAATAEAGPAWTPPPMSAASPTLDALGESRRPKASTVCEECPNSVWFASSAEVKCYCRVMFLVTWSSNEPNQITHCDGTLLG
ncbi:TraH protein of DNA transfer system (plasmid) [Aromatoleum aromaticum EbN1]|uniref:TraH protein of DNA transfer system n=1 Tax=Aromatoleum aromaticum (strain DSM 19018 / LMG 30748 / EbN1) TaxID=76114 RepID=Q5NWI8_AROAE|nr:TraH protein of DNA transfer system [Aromatoleum aromaticum EbN1]